jgi:hypothetical protein
MRLNETPRRDPVSFRTSTRRVKSMSPGTRRWSALVGHSRPEARNPACARWSRASTRMDVPSVRGPRGLAISAPSDPRPLRPHGRALTDGGRDLKSHAPFFSAGSATPRLGSRAARDRALPPESARSLRSPGRTRTPDRRLPVGPLRRGRSVLREARGGGGRGGAPLTDPSAGRPARRTRDGLRLDRAGRRAGSPSRGRSAARPALLG